MEIKISHRADMVRCRQLADLAGDAAVQPGSDEQILVNDELTAQERQNIALVDGFWKAWKAVPFDIDVLRQFFAQDVIIRTGWRGEHVMQGRENALAMFASEVQRQTDYGEVSDFRFPIVVAKGPIVFHTWVWIARSERRGYHIERPMAAFYLINDGLIERWDDYCTGRESEPGYVGGNGPDGL